MRLLYDPTHPHCGQCDCHITPDMADTGVVLVGLVHQTTGERAYDILCVDCALQDEDIGPRILADVDPSHLVGGDPAHAN